MKLFPLLSRPSSAQSELAKVRVASRSHPMVRCLKCLHRALPFIFTLTLADISAQAIPAFREPTRVFVFADFTAAQPSIGSGDPAVVGATLGGYLQSPYLVGFDLRGAVVRVGGLDHESSALAGPRIAFHRARFSPYGEFLIGGGHAWRPGEPTPQNPRPRLITGVGLQWSVVGGVDFYLRHRLSLRLGELGFSKIYTTRKVRSPIDYSAGLVYRFK